MRTVLLVAADPIELKGLLLRLPRSTALEWPVDYARAVELGERRWLLVANGPGSRLAGEAVREAAARERLDAVVSTGFCGALDPRLQAGDIYVANRVVTQGGSSFPAAIPRGAEGVESGTLWSVDRVIRTAEEKRALRAATAAGVVDMESLALGDFAQRSGLPFYCVRAVTDTAEESFGQDWNAMRGADGRFQRGRIALAAMLRPWTRVPELIHWWRRSRTASAALGRFLARCDF